MTSARTTFVIALCALGCGRAAPANPLPPGTDAQAKAPAPEESARPLAPHRQRITTDEVALSSKGASLVHIAWALPKGTGINDEAPFHVRWSESDGLAAAPAPISGRGGDVKAGFDVSITPIAGTSGGRLVGDVDVVVCDEDTHKVCVPLRQQIELPFRVAASENERATVTVPLPAARP